VQRLDALGRGVGAVVARDEQLGAAEAGLAVEDGLVADGDLGGDGVDIELNGISAKVPGTDET
jgi:hypothetical protein